MRTLLFYDAAKIDGPKKKLLEFNATDSFMDDKELKVFESLCEALSDKDAYWKTKFTEYHSALMRKLTTIPLEKLFPALDLYRIFLTHPDSTCHFKKFEEGWSNLATVLAILREPEASDPTKMLALRCMVNMFRDQSAVYVLREKRERCLEAVAPHLQNAKANVRESAYTVLLNYSIAFLTKDDPEGRIQLISALDLVGKGKETEEQC